jgi:hypothetical protein
MFCLNGKEAQDDRPRDRFACSPFLMIPDAGVCGPSPEEPVDFTGAHSGSALVFIATQGSAEEPAHDEDADRPNKAPPGRLAVPVNAMTLSENRAGKGKMRLDDFPHSKNNPTPNQVTREKNKQMEFKSQYHAEQVHMGCG